MGDTLSTIMRSTIRQLVTPDYYARADDFDQYDIFMGGPLGQMEAGLAAALISCAVSVATGGVSTLILVGVTAWKVPEPAKLPIEFYV